MQSIPYTDIVKVYGVPRSGTTYWEMLIRENSHTLVLADHLGFQHGQVIREIDWEGLNWPNPDYWSYERIKLLKRVTDPYQEDIQRRFNEDKLYFVFIIKNPYSWYHSIRVMRKAEFSPLCTKNIYHWNERNRHYLEYHEGHPDNTYFVRYEDFYYEGYKEVLMDMGSRLNLIMATNLENVKQVVSQKTPESEIGEFNIKKYEDRYYLDRIGKDVIQTINDHVDERLMHVFSYEYE